MKFGWKVFFALLTIAMVQMPAGAAEKLKPFLLSSHTGDDFERVVADVTARLEAAGFEVAGSHSPYQGTAIITVTSDALKATAAKSEFGGYGAVQRVSIALVGDKIQVAYTNPPYWAAAYRMAGDLSGTAALMKMALGAGQSFGSEDGMTDADLREYHYMFGMEYFTDPHELARHADHQAALAAVEQGLADKVMGVSKVYRVDIPGKQESVFGVAMNGKDGGGDQQDDAYIMSTIDFKDLKSAAHLPYEMLVSGDKVYALSARFRIAISFPDLSMMGSNSFFSIMGSPDAIRAALSAAAGGDWKPE